jgi:hypothetical protein
VRKIVALALWAVTAAGVLVLCCGSLTIDGRGPEVTVARVVKDHGDAGLEALKASRLVKAEHEFTQAGDDVRLAETFIRQGRWDEAALLVEGKEDGGAKLMLALVHQHRCEFGEYRRRLTEARNLGNEAAANLLECTDAGG